MTLANLQDHCRASIAEHGFIAFPEDMLAAMSAEQADALRTEFGARNLMLLPDHEREFFAWLRIHDVAVWRDLWEADEQPYLVSLAHLKHFCGNGTQGAYIIRDLLSVPNYYFSPELFLEKESADFMAAVRERFAQRDALTLAQMLALEASVGPIDIWHFAYRYDVDLETAKKAVATLVNDRILLHVPQADHLTQYFDVD
jgi:hypothetical protein